MKADTDSRKLQARDAYKRFTEQRFQTQLGKLNDKQRSEGLAAFYIDEIHSRLHSPISPEDFELGFVDAPSDLGVDFIHKDDDTVLILQAKYCGDGKRIDVKDITHFQTVLTRLSNRDFKPNQRLEDVLAYVDFERDNFIFKFVALGTIDGQARHQADLVPDLPRGLGERAEFHFMDASQLTEELRNAHALSAGVPGEFTLHATGRRRNRAPIIELEHADYPSCVLVVSATQLVLLYQTYQDRIFTLNIRNYLGSTNTNKEISNTIRSEPQSFYYYNNGIACLAEHLEILDDRVVTRGLQVINGAQTVRSLAKTRGAKLDEILVIVRITQAAKEYGAEGRFRTNIVKWNNTQNVIKLADFRSNDAVQQDMRKRFALIKRDGHSVAYVPKRTDPASLRASEVIPIEEFAKVVHSFLFDPVAFSARTSFLFDDSESGGYVKIFGDGEEIWTTMPEGEFRLRAAIWWISRDFADQISRDRKATQDPLLRAALERKWFLLYVARLVLQRSYGGDAYREDLQKLYRGEWNFGNDAVGRWLHQLYDVSKEILVWSYSDAARKQGFIHRNWMRSKDTVDALADYVKLAPIRVVPRRSDA